MLYRMMNDARARAVAKDLQQIARELGMDMSLTRSQALVSQMMGYRDWRHLQSEIGVDGITGPEDEDLLSSEKQGRLQLQVQALIHGGFPVSKVPEIVSRLRPTGRSAASSARQIVPYPHNERYHPNRLSSIWSRLDDYAVVIGGDFDGEYYEALKILRTWALGRRLSKLDEAVIAETRNPDGAAMTALDVMMGDAYDRGWLVDASSLEQIVKDRIDEAALTSFPKDWDRRAIYVHLGKNAFHSPYGDVGVEGVYLEVDVEDYLEGPRQFHITATIVCSEPNYPASGPDAGDCRNAAIRLRDNLRFATVGFYAEGDLNLQSVVKRYKANADGSDLAWADFLESPVNVAVNALGVYLRKAVPVFDAVPLVSDDVRKKVERAVTDKQFLSAVGKRENDDFFVRSLGLAPVIEMENHNRRADPVGSMRGSDADSINILIDDSFDLEANEAARFMRVVHDLAYERRLNSFEDSRAWVRSLAALLQAELHSGDHDNALRTAHDIEQSGSPAVRPYLPLVWLAHRLVGYSESAERLEKAAGGIKFKPLVEDALARLGDVNAVANFMENGAQRPFMVQVLEAGQDERNAVLTYTSAFHYGHDDSDDVQMIREAFLSGRNAK